jgi:hypothetical protein
MNKAIITFLACSFLITSCKKQEKQNTEKKPEIEEVQKNTFSINANATEINWTAYKTTAKTAVKGVFTSLKIDNPIKSMNKQDTFENLEFSIPISSFYSKNEIRDSKIKKLFFGFMKDTELISGNFTNINGDDKEGTMSLNLKMNGETVVVPMKYSISENIVNIDGTIKDLLDWKMDKAFNSIHKACEILHTGEDGVSKTWQEVAISATAVLKKN